MMNIDLKNPPPKAVKLTDYFSDQDLLSAHSLPLVRQLLQKRCRNSPISLQKEGYLLGDSEAVLTDLDDTAGSNPPSTLRYLSRVYSYDNVGRVIGGGGTH